MHYFPLIWQIYLRWTLNYMGNFNFIDNFSIVQITLPLAKKKKQKKPLGQRKTLDIPFQVLSASENGVDKASQNVAEFGI